MMPALVERELRVALLRRKARRQWLGAAWTAGGITLFFMVVSGLDAHRSAGRRLFFYLFAVALYGIVRRGFGLTADLFSEERRNGTLGLLVLTGLRPLEIFAYKLFGAVLLTVYGLLGGLPFFAIPFLAGGVPAAQFLCAFVFLANALLFCIALGVLASVLHRDGGQAQLTAQALAALFCAVTPALYWFSSLTTGPSGGWDGWLPLSPAYPAYLVATGLSGGAQRLFWLGSTVTLGYSFLALGLAAWILQRTWRERPEARASSGWRKRWQTGLRGGTWPRRLRTRLLADQPFCWLAARDRTPVLVAYGILALGVAGWLTGWLALGPRWLSPGYVFPSAMVLHLGLNLVGAYAAGRRFAEERLSGGFEILLTAPLTAAAIVDGQSKALMVQFREVGLLALALDLGLCTCGFVALKPDALTASVYLAAWTLVLLFWFGAHLEVASRAMWISAWTGRPGYAALKAGAAQWWPLVWMWMLSQRRGRIWFGNEAVALVFLGFLTVPVLLTFSRRYVVRQKLTKELRQIASAPIPAREDSYFKSWDPDKIFPPNPWGRRGLGAEPKGRMDSLQG